MNEITSTNKKQFHIDYYMLCICFSLLVIGYLMVVSSSLHLNKGMGNNDFLHYPVRQMIHIFLGIIAAIIVASIPIKIWEKTGQWLFLVGLFLLIIVLHPSIGVEVKGSTRWIQLPGIRIQVSEIVKFISVIYMAGYVTRHQQDLQQSLYGLIKPLLIFLAACFLLLLEPDFGSSVVIMVIAMGIMYLSGAQLWQFLLILGGLLVVGALLIYFSNYRSGRIIGFMNPWADAENTGFQLVQALIAFGRGELIGVGLGNGIQKLFYIPEAHTDFLLSVLAEELGLLGVLLTIGLFTLLVCHIFKIAMKAELAGDKFASYVAYGLGIWFGFQAFVNMGVNMGILPTKGITLPLMSYGGGSMVTMCASIAVVFRIHSDNVEKEKSAPKGRPEWIGA